MKTGSFIKRLNLLLIIIAVCVCGLVAYVSQREFYRDDLMSGVYATHADETAALEKFPDAPSKHGPWEAYGGKPKFDPDQFLAQRSAEENRAKYVKERIDARPPASRALAVAKGVGVGFLCFAVFLLLMLTLSWLFGAGFKLHVSTR